jgi:hypothetical protein
MSKNMIEFQASIATTASALQAHGECGFRVVLDLSETEQDAFFALVMARNRVLKIAIEPK